MSTCFGIRRMAHDDQLYVLSSSVSWFLFTILELFTSDNSFLKLVVLYYHTETKYNKDGLTYHYYRLFYAKCLKKISTNVHFNFNYFHMLSYRRICFTLGDITIVKIRYLDYKKFLSKKNSLRKLSQNQDGLSTTEVFRRLTG